jgi:hypothetical protein
MARLLFPGGVRCSVSCGARLSFPPRDEVLDAFESEPPYWAFAVEGVVFELHRAVLSRLPAAVAARVTESAPRLRSAELLPIALDFLVRRSEDPQACLRTGALTLGQTRSLDALEAALFPSLTPERVFADEARTRVLVALLPGYRKTFFGAFALHERATAAQCDEDAFLYHDGLEGLCMDARFVRMVQAGKVTDPAIARRLEEEFDLRKPLTDALVDACELIPVDRGLPFCIESRECGGDQYQCVAEEPPVWHVA